jgi:3-oxoacyl-[acyl-carrier protein] reductase
LTEQPVTLITGTRKGIGRFLVDHYMQRGHVVVGCSRKPLTDTIPGYEHFCIDIADEGAVKSMMIAIRRKYGRLDHLINNAGIASMNHFLLTPAETVMRIYQTNVVGTFLCCREGSKVMKDRKFGRIVNFSSAATPLKLAGEAVYASSKAAVVNLTGVLAHELGGYGITINTVGPTPIPTDLIGGVPPEKIQNLINRQAVRRVGTFEDVANVVDFFLRPESDFITGQVIYLGGF